LGEGVSLGEGLSLGEGVSLQCVPNAFTLQFNLLYF